MSRPFLLKFLFLVALSGGEDPAVAAPLTDLRATYARPAAVPHPKDNPHTQAREDLGRMLFFDPRLSGSDWISCATCHNPALSWSDGLPLALGHGMRSLERRSPTILNLAWGEPLMWDGRAATLEEQALGPVTSAVEMNLTLDKLVAKLGRVEGYARLFEAAYPGEGVSAQAVAKALATYQRTVVSGEAPFDRWVKGEEGAISESAKRGFVLFNEKALCAKCHAGWRFTDDSFHDIGLESKDLGRGKLLPEIDVMRHAFKTPTLRNIDQRRPYMHDGSEATLAEVIDFYDRGGKVQRPSVSEHIKPLHLTPKEKGDLLAFLATLTSEDPAVVVPRLPL